MPHLKSVLLAVISLYSIFFISTLILKIEANNVSMVPDGDDDDNMNGKRRVVNFASVTAGAVVLESSPQSVGFSNLLSDDKDKYGISPCSEKKWVVIGLSEDIMVVSIVMKNYEKYSSKLHEFQVLGSSTYPVSQWMDLGQYEALPKLGEQTFNLTTPLFVRYLKFRFLTHYGDEFYCTLSQICVHGSTVIENMQSEFELSNKEIKNIQSIIQADDLRILLLEEEAAAMRNAAQVMQEFANEQHEPTVGVHATIMESTTTAGSVHQQIVQDLVTPDNTPIAATVTAAPDTGLNASAATAAAAGAVGAVGEQHEPTADASTSTIASASVGRSTASATGVGSASQPAVTGAEAVQDMASSSPPPVSANNDLTNDPDRVVAPPEGVEVDGDAASASAAALALTLADGSTAAGSASSAATVETSNSPSAAQAGAGSVGTVDSEVGQGQGQVHELGRVAIEIAEMPNTSSATPPTASSKTELSGSREGGLVSGMLTSDSSSASPELESARERLTDGATDSSQNLTPDHLAPSMDKGELAEFASQSHSQDLPPTYSLKVLEGGVVQSTVPAESTPSTNQEPDTNHSANQEDSRDLRGDSTAPSMGSTSDEDSLGLTKVNEGDLPSSTCTAVGCQTQQDEIQPAIVVQESEPSANKSVPSPAELKSHSSCTELDSSDATADGSCAETVSSIGQSDATEADVPVARDVTADASVVTTGIGLGAVPEGSVLDSSTNVTNDMEVGAVDAVKVVAASVLGTVATNDAALSCATTGSADKTRESSVGPTVPIKSTVTDSFEDNKDRPGVAESSGRQDARTTVVAEVGEATSMTTVSSTAVLAMVDSGPKSAKEQPHSSTTAATTATTLATSIAAPKKVDDKGIATGEDPVALTSAPDAVTASPSQSASTESPAIPDVTKKESATSDSDVSVAAVSAAHTTSIAHISTVSDSTNGAGSVQASGVVAKKAISGSTPNVLPTSANLNTPTQSSGNGSSPAAATTTATSATTTTTTTTTTTSSTGAGTTTSSSAAKSSAATSPSPAPNGVHSHSRIPLACIDNLRFTDFQAKVLSKRQQHASDNDRPAGASQQDSVIRALIQKITTLEFNFAVLEMYSSQISECYRVVLHELSHNSSELSNNASALSVKVDTGSDATRLLEKTIQELKSEVRNAKEPEVRVVETIKLEATKPDKAGDEKSDKHLLTICIISLVLAFLSIFSSCVLTYLVIRNSSRR